MTELKNNQPSSKKWKAGFYIRLSREDVESESSNQTIKTYNKTESESITSQRAILMDFITKHNDIEFCDEYVDDGYSGTNFNRPSFKRLIDDVRSGKINCVIVKDLSRFGRNYSEVGNYLEVFFPMLNVRFMSIIDNCDSYLKPESVSNIIIPVKNIINESYSRDISLKVKSAFEARKRNGLFVGTYATFGYLKDPQNHNKLIVDEEAKPIVQRIFNDYLNGMSKVRIAKQLNEEGIPSPALYKSSQGITKYIKEYGAKTGWKDSSIRRILTNPLYTGTLVQKFREKINYKIQKFRKVEKDRQIRVENVVEPIIDKATFDMAQNLIERDTRVCFENKSVDLLSGFLHCADCKHGMSKKKSRKGNSKTEYIEYYNCSTYKNCGKSVCSAHNIRKDKLEETVFEYIKTCVNVAVNFNDIITYINQLKNEDVKTDNLRKMLDIKINNKTKKQNYIDGLYPDYRANIISLEEYNRYKNQALKELEILDNEITELQNQINDFKLGNAKENDFISRFKEYESIEKLDRRMVVELIDNIWIHENNFIEIDIKFKDQYQMALEFVKNNAILLAENNLINKQKVAI